MSDTDFDPALKQRQAYKFWVRDFVRFTDLDALGHASAVRVNEYFNDARATLFHKSIDKWPYAAQLPVMKLAVTQYEKEIKFPSIVEAGLVIEKFGRTSFTAAAGLFGGDECLALSRNIFVFIDAQSRAPTAPDERIVKNFMELAGPPDLQGKEADHFAA